MLPLQAGKLYVFRYTAATLMKVYDLSLDTPGCSMGILSRDGIPIPSIPRLTSHMLLGPANRCPSPSTILVAWSKQSRLLPGKAAELPGLRQAQPLCSCRGRRTG